MNVLESSGLPAFFALADDDARALPLPENRHGQSIRVWARSLSVMQKEAIVRSALTGKTWRLASDEGPYLDGFDAAPCPLAFFSVGMVGMYMNEIVALAAERGIALGDLVLVQDSFYTMEGSALRGTMTSGALPVELEIRIDADAAEGALQNLCADAVQASPLNGLLHGVYSSLFSLRKNGRTLSPERVASIEPLALPDPGETLTHTLPRTVRGAALVERTAAVETVEGVVGGAHTSLKDRQSRKLHVRATCRRRADGVQEIMQQIFSPLGSTFRFLADEAEGFGGHGRAPDAATYAAAGLAFCFMTQLGRYAKIVKQSLEAYDVVQDAHFSLGGASGKTGRPGYADPIETHVYLTSAADDGFALQALAMGEQTCFLHALCRKSLKTIIRIVRA